MLAKAPLAVLPALTPARHAPHALHDGSRDWPETNCYVDVWIEILHAIGADPRAALGFTVAQDFEGDQFTFSKMPLDDLYDLYGLEVTELALYDTLEAHVEEQTRRGRMVIVEVDAFGLPDTRGLSYRREHVKTTIAINRIDSQTRSLDYFHGPGLFALSGDDYDTMMRPGRGDALLPYAEFVKFDRRLARPDGDAALRLLRRHAGRRPAQNPVAAFRDRLRDQAIAAADRDTDFLHKYAFATARQLGMNVALLGDHLTWLQAESPAAATLDFNEAIGACAALSSAAKSFQFQLARAVSRKRFDTIEANLDPLIGPYDRIVAGLAAL